MFDLSIPTTISSQAMRFMGSVSNENLLRIISLLEPLASIEWQKQGIGNIKAMIREDHHGIRAAKRALKTLNPRARAAVLNNLVLGGLLTGYKKRLKFYNEFNVAPPGVMQISPTFRCNMKCYGCAIGTHDAGNSLSRKEVEQLVADAADSGTNLIMFLGGEPLINPWLIDVMEQFPKVAFLVFSNGLLLTDEKIERIAKMGNVSIALSVDGLRENTDKRRGEGTFDKITAIMRKLNQAGVFVGFSAMLCRHNFEEIFSDAFMDAMIENGALYGWIPMVIPQGKAITETELLPTPQQKATLREKLKDLRRRKEILLLDFYTDAYITEGCSAARLVVHVNPDGDVEPCILFPFAVDNIREKPYSDILKSDFFQAIRKIREEHPFDKQTCMMRCRPTQVVDAVKRCHARETSQGTLERLEALAKRGDV